MENLTGGTPPVRYLPCVVPCKLYFFVVIISIFIYRPFCKYICPLGALYGLFNRFSFYRMEIDKNKCIDCKVCERNCRMQVKVLENINSAECIRCMECKNICPKGAIETNFFEKKL
ncbi:4Fe-4S binding protein [Hungatella sp. SB206]|uniref:4Fe-4S binding protein n=1 Tax=Hungatella sp. SB206 TaxID=2937758 RepID=UPI003DA7C221